MGAVRCATWSPEMPFEGMNSGNVNKNSFVLRVGTNMRRRNNGFLSEGNAPTWGRWRKFGSF